MSETIKTPVIHRDRWHLYAADDEHLACFGKEEYATQAITAINEAAALREQVQSANKRNMQQRHSNRTLLQENKRLRRELYGLRGHWRTLAGFAVCESSPEGYSVKISYPTLTKAQDGYSALAAIGEVLNDKGPWRYNAKDDAEVVELKEQVAHLQSIIANTPSALGES